jgi:hypothetical protein
VTDLQSQGITQARLYGNDESVYGGLNALFLLMDEPEAYRLPSAANAVLPSRNNLGGYLTALITAVLAVFGALIALRRRREPSPVTGETSAGAGPDRGTSPGAKADTQPEATGGGTPPGPTGGDE